MNLLLDPREFRLLEGLRLNPKKSFSGRVRGERLTKKKGISIEFSDYRDYVEGDDLRHLDWNVLARLETPIMKTYRDEEDLAVHILLDGSASMSFGEPTKFEAARRIAAAVGYVGLCGGDAVYCRLLGQRGLILPGLRGRSSFPRFTRWLEDAKPAGEESLAASLRAFAHASARVGLAVVVSDGLDPEAATAVRVLGGRGHEVFFIQVLSDIELDPDLEGDLRLLDSEGGRAVEITANSYALREYRANLQRHNDALREAVLRVGGRHAMVRADDPLEKTVKQVLRREGWVAA
ncbi:MAG TPA: DUF58 domain-containing protein [Fimbriimonadaceae bacterium]|nr:DUF58 domain-containing protein [Fimbriimonadaceae bacterium]